jgi:glycosyltransferase involved in cell wall biosynthesis
MTYTKDFSVIIPVWRGAIKFLPKLFDSIPDKEGIEIIVVDNSKEPVAREEIDSSRQFILKHIDPNRHAGGSRNEGIKISKGKWLLFADADDYYTPDAFDIYYSMIDTDAEIVYTGMGGVYEDTGEHSSRGDGYAYKVHRYCIGEADEFSLRLDFASPCCKMVSHDLVDRHEIKYDEIRAGNDMFFSLKSGYYAKTITAVDRVTYIATVNRGSLTKRRDFEVLHARLYAKLRCNQFLKSVGLRKEQKSVMYLFYEGRHCSFKEQLTMFKMLFQYRQNPFIGCWNWFKSLTHAKERNKREEKYIIR